MSSKRSNEGDCQWSLCCCVVIVIAIITTTTTCSTLVPAYLLVILVWGCIVLVLFSFVIRFFLFLPFFFETESYVAQADLKLLSMDDLELLVLLPSLLKC